MHASCTPAHASGLLHECWVRADAAEPAASHSSHPGTSTRRTMSVWSVCRKQGGEGQHGHEMAAVRSIRRLRRAGACPVDSYLERVAILSAGHGHRCATPSQASRS